MTEADTNWFYIQDQKQIGPVPFSELKRKIELGEIGPQDYVWTEGMAQWVFAKQLNTSEKAANPAIAEVIAPVSIPLPVSGTVEYYSAAVPLPARAAESLQKHAEAVGDRLDWPLDDQRVAQFAETMKLRKRISQAALVFWVGFWQFIFQGIFIVVIGMTSPTTRGVGTRVLAMLIVAGMMGAGALLCQVSAIYTRKSHRWAALVMIIFTLLGIVIWGAFGAVTARSRGTRGVPVILFLMLECAIGAFIAIRAYMAIPTYVKQPAWCQELAAAGKI
jgi:uncharacterized protein with PQ loop repeat